MRRLEVMTWQQAGKLMHEKEVLSSTVVYLYACMFVGLVLMSIFHMWLMFSHKAKGISVSALVTHML